MIVAGGRDFNDYGLLCICLDALLDKNQDIEIVSGHAKGADTLGERYAEEHNLPVSIFIPDWKTNWRRAGFERNTKMIEYAREERPMVIAFWDGQSHGTKDTIRKAWNVGMDCFIVYYGGGNTALKSPIWLMDWAHEKDV